MVHDRGVWHGNMVLWFQNYYQNFCRHQKGGVASNIIGPRSLWAKTEISRGIALVKGLLAGLPNRPLIFDSQ